ncbi:MAG TPA: CDP-alcohol phosphatidyltransferase family protein, partial [Burkholderiaceae bacterium]|nr:CDP-alcohol phosphatidyltransferase family protein [Burkholderiaceae bacterium]
PSPDTAGAAWPGLLPGLKHDVQRDLLMAALALGPAALGLGTWAGLGARYAGVALLLFGLAAAALWQGLPGHPHARFGPANRVTLGRLAAVALFAALSVEMALQPLPDPDRVAWSLVVLATLAAVVDAADGPLARASGLASPFGARFDMETDALLILVLCVLIVQFGKAGPWVLAAGLMRYAFVAAAALPRGQWLNAPLPPSLRRKGVCVGLIVVLITCLGPVIPRWAASALAAAGVGTVGWSFAVDIAWLWRGRH